MLYRQKKNRNKKARRFKSGFLCLVTGGGVAVVKVLCCAFVLLPQETLFVIPEIYYLYLTGNLSIFSKNKIIKAFPIAAIMFMNLCALTGLMNVFLIALKIINPIIPPKVLVILASSIAVPPDRVWITNDHLVNSFILSSLLSLINAFATT